MREIVSLQLGNCGNSMGVEFWANLGNEHGVSEEGKWEGDSDLQLERINVYYQEGYYSNRYVPRMVAVDLDGKKLDNILSGRNRHLFRRDNFVGGSEGGSNNYGRGYFSDGRLYIDQVMDVTRREVESSDSLQGFQVMHSVGGGTGAGTTGLLLDHLAEEFDGKTVATFSVLPSPKVSDIVVEPYNAVLGIRHLISNADMVFCLDNEALLSNCVYGLRLANPTYGDLNHLISNAMSGITTCLRFPGQLNTGLAKLAVNNVPFPQLHFLMPAYVPLISRRHLRQHSDLDLTIAEMVRQMFQPKCLMCAADMRQGRFLTATSIFRGRMSTREVETSMKLIQNKNANSFVEWIPDNLKVAICDIPPRGLKRSATFFTNNTAVATLWFRILEQFRAMFRRRAYLHWYLGEGMEEEDFADAECALLDLVDEYVHRTTNSDWHGEDGGDQEMDPLDAIYRPSTPAARPMDQTGDGRPKSVKYANSDIYGPRDKSKDQRRKEQRTNEQRTNEPRRNEQRTTPQPEKRQSRASSGRLANEDQEMRHEEGETEEDVRRTSENRTRTAHAKTSLPELTTSSPKLASPPTRVVSSTYDDTRGIPFDSSTGSKPLPENEVDPNWPEGFARGGGSEAVPPDERSEHRISVSDDRDRPMRFSLVESKSADKEVNNRLASSVESWEQKGSKSSLVVHTWPSQDRYNSSQVGHRPSQEVHRSSQEGQRSSQEGYRPRQDVHRSSQNVHRSNQELLRSSQEGQRSSQQSQGVKANSSRTSDLEERTSFKVTPVTLPAVAPEPQPRPEARRSSSSDALDKWFNGYQKKRNDNRPK